MQRTPYRVRDLLKYFEPTLKKRESAFGRGVHARLFGIYKPHDRTPTWSTRFNFFSNTAFVWGVFILRDTILNG